MLDMRVYQAARCTGKFAIATAATKPECCCAVCGRDSRGSQRRRFVEIEFRSQYSARDIRTESVCMFCAARLFPPQSSSSLEHVERAMNQEENRSRHANLFVMIAEIEETAALLPDVRHFLALHAAGSTVSPAIASRTATILHALTNDADLLASFRWLHSPACPSTLAHLRHIFSGEQPGVWPTMEQRARVRALRSAC